MLIFTSGSGWGSKWRNIERKAKKNKEEKTREKKIKHRSELCGGLGQMLHQPTLRFTGSSVAIKGPTTTFR